MQSSSGELEVCVGATPLASNGSETKSNLIKQKSICLKRLQSKQNQIKKSICLKGTSIN